jgi:hypothetical protein
MTHAILVEGSGKDSTVLQSTISVLDDPAIDFFIHWDAKFPQPSGLYAKYSKIYFISPIKVYWGGDSQIKATIKLIKYVMHRSKKYDYLHLISSSDIPLMTPNYFKRFFTHQVYLGFDDSKDYSWRVKYYYPHLLIEIVAKTQAWWIITFWRKLQSKLGISRNNELTIMKGCNWWSIRSDVIYKVLDYDISKFNYSFCGDEIFMQTILDHSFDRGNSKFISDSKQAARFTFWDLHNKSNKKKYFDLTDITSLERLVNTNFAFLRKVNDKRLAEKLFKINKK